MSGVTQTASSISLASLEARSIERSMNSLESFDYAGKQLLLRYNLNVPIKDGVITDDGRIRASLPTIQYLIGKGASGNYYRPPRPTKGGAQA
jgi:hypothetical protein